MATCVRSKSVANHASIRIVPTTVFQRFSSGPHAHFEVQIDGRPVNADILQDSKTSCIKLGDGEILRLQPDWYSKQVEAAKILLARRQADLEKAQSRVFATNLALTLGGSLLAAMVVYGLFTSLGWALAGFAKD